MGSRLSLTGVCGGLVQKKKFPGFRCPEAGISVTAEPGWRGQAGGGGGGVLHRDL